MRRIHTIKGPPESFKQWLKANEQEINKKLTGDDIWVYFHDNCVQGNINVYKELKKVLLKDQGFICCYCGKRIFDDHNTVIEHLIPKGSNKDLTLDFDNLLASCNGGSSHQIHIVENNETILQIAQKYGVDVAHIEEVYVSIDEERLFRNKYDIENLSKNDRIVIFPKMDSLDLHCDAKKGKSNITINPLQDNCQDKFSYNPLNGKIICTDDNTSTIQTLGLNSNRYINQLRKKTLDDSIILKQNLMNDFGHSVEEFEENRLKLKMILDDISYSNGYLDPFVFVTIWSLDN